MTGPGRQPGIVIGAGPAGLALAGELVRRGVACRVLESGPGPGDAWRRMPTAMRLNSGWAASRLPGTRVVPGSGSRRLSRAAYHEYLVRYAEERRIPVEALTRVDKLERVAGGGFRVITSRGSFEAPWVVNATGYFTAPFVPEIPGLARAGLPCVTVPDYGSAAALERRLGGTGRVLVVGHRITAGQIAEELHDGGFAVTISHRSPIRFGWAPGLQQLGYALFYPYERLRLRYGSYGARSSLLPMPGGRIRRLVRSGRIATRPAIAQVETSGRVRFADESAAAFDALLFATGYRPALPHLEGLVRLDPETGLPRLAGAASVEVPGLYFLGLDQQRDLTSRMLRGIRRDATALAATLAAREGAR